MPIDLLSYHLQSKKKKKKKRKKSYIRFKLLCEYFFELLLLKTINTFYLSIYLSIYFTLIIIYLRLIISIYLSQFIYFAIAVLVSLSVYLLIHLKLYNPYPCYIGGKLISYSVCVCVCVWVCVHTCVPVFIQGDCKVITYFKIFKISFLVKIIVKK